MGESGRGSGGGGVWGAVELRRVGGGLIGKTNKPQARKEMGSSLRDTEKNYLSCARTKKKSERKKKNSLTTLNPPPCLTDLEKEITSAAGIIFAVPLWMHT